MRVDLCSFSGFKIYPGHGQKYIRPDGKVFQFADGKCEAAFLAKRNPREIDWTVLYRRKYKKGQSVDVSKKPKRKGPVKAVVVKPIIGLDVEKIKKPIQAAKAAKTPKDENKKPSDFSGKAHTKMEPKPKFAKPIMKTAPRVSGKR